VSSAYDRVAVIGPSVTVDSGVMARKPQASRSNTARSRRNVKTQPTTSTRSPSPPPMSRPGTVELPEPAEPGIPLAAVAHSMEIDTRRKFAATYEDITQYMDKCEYLFDHDEFYDKSYKSLAKTITELNKIGNDAQQQEREQLYNGLVDWLSTSSFTLEAPTHGVINEHQLIESGQTTRDVYVKMLLGLERLRALHITIVDKARSAAELAVKQTDKVENKRKLLKMVDDSSFVWKTAAAEIVQLLHEERSKGGELVELYADKIRYLMGELEAQSNMIEELRMQLDQQPVLPLKIHDLDMQAKRAKHEMASRHAKQTGGSQQHTTTDDIDKDDLRAAAAVSTLPDFNKQLITTLQKELEECRRQNASLVARGHEAAAKIRFLTEESNRKDKQIAQLQANIIKLKSETREVEAESQPIDASTRNVSDSPHGRQTGRRSTGKTARQKPTRDTIHLQDTEEQENAASRMKLTQLVAAAKRQKRPSRPSLSAVDESATSVPSQPASQSTGAGLASRTDTSRRGRNIVAPMKPGKTTHGLRGARGKMGAVDRVATAVAVPDKQLQATDDVLQAPTFEQLGSFWQQSIVKEWTPVDMNMDTANAAKEVKTAKGSAAQQTPVHDVDMNEAIEMTKLFVAASKTQQQQQPVKARPRRESIQQQRRPVAPATHVTAISPQLFAEPSATSAPQQQQADKSVVTSYPHPAETSESVSSRQHRARTPAEAAKLRAARLSVVLFHSDDARSHKPVVQSPFSSTSALKPNQQQQKQQQNAAITKSKPRAKAGYDLVGVNMHNLAQQAKLLETGSVPKTSQRFN